MVSSFSPLCPFINMCRRFQIYERIEKYETMQWNYIGYFGDKEYEMSFPPVIQPIEKGKFIVFPQEVKHKRDEIDVEGLNVYNHPVNPLEVWEKNRTFIRSHLNCTMDFPNYVENLWILQM